MSEPNLALASVLLFQAHETHTTETIHKKNHEVGKHITHMEKLHHFIAMATERTQDSNRLDMSLPEDQALIDELRAYGDTNHIFPHGKYEWKEKELEHLHEKINQHIQGPLQRLVNMGSEEMVLLQHELTKALDLFKNGLMRMNRQVEQILSNIQRSR